MNNIWQPFIFLTMFTLEACCGRFGLDNLSLAPSSIQSYLAQSTQLGSALVFLLLPAIYIETTSKDTQLPWVRWVFPASRDFAHVAHSSSRLLPFSRLPTSLPFSYQPLKSQTENIILEETPIDTPLHPHTYYQVYSFVCNSLEQLQTNPQGEKIRNILQAKQTC